MTATPRALVVYESMFGNTFKVAAAIRAGLEGVVVTDLVRADQAPAAIPADVCLLVVGGPTHAFSMSRPSTRQDASNQGSAIMPAETGIREWLGTMGSPTTPALAATFDTRITKVRHLPGELKPLLGTIRRR